MAQPLDIFRIDGVRWVGSAEDLEAAKVLIKAPSEKEPGDFLVVNIDTGWHAEIKADHPA